MWAIQVPRFVEICTDQAIVFILKIQNNSKSFGTRYSHGRTEWRVRGSSVGRAAGARGPGTDFDLLTGTSVSVCTGHRSAASQLHTHALHLHACAYTATMLNPISKCYASDASATPEASTPPANCQDRAFQCRRFLDTPMLPVEESGMRSRS